MRLRTSGAVLWLAGMVPAGAQPAPSPQVLTLLHTVDEHYNHLNSLRARFVEQYHGMGMSREEGGTLLLKKPGKMAWHYDVPAGKLFVFDGKFAWFYTPGDAQAQKIPARQMDDLRTPLRFSAGTHQAGKRTGQYHGDPGGRSDSHRRRAEGHGPAG